MSARKGISGTAVWIGMALGLFLCWSAPARAVNATIAAQDFDTIGPAYPTLPSQNLTDTFPIGSSNQPLTNIGSKYDGVSPTIGGGMTFKTLWTDTRGTAGPVTVTGDTTGDFIGVNAFPGAGNPTVNPFGVPYAAFHQYNYEFDDGDGRLSLTFDPVSLNGFRDPTISFYFWVSNTSFESTDRMSIDASLAGTPASIAFTNASLNTFATDGTWHSITISLLNTPFLGPTDFATLTISVDTNANDENIFVDNVLITGDPLPEPISAATFLLGLGGIGLAALRRRRRA